MPVHSRLSWRLEGCVGTKTNIIYISDRTGRSTGIQPWQVSLGTADSDEAGLGEAPSISERRGFAKNVLRSVTSEI